jgi:COMPASS component SWD3
VNQKNGQRKFLEKIEMGDFGTSCFSCRYDPTDKYVAAGYGDGAIRVYNTVNGKVAYTLAEMPDEKGNVDEMPITCLRWRPTNDTMKTSNVLVSCSADGWIRHWHATSGKCLHKRQCEDHTNQ